MKEIKAEVLLYKLEILTSYIGHHPCPTFDDKVKYFSTLGEAEIIYDEYQCDGEDEDVHPYSGSGCYVNLLSAPMPTNVSVLVNLLNEDTFAPEENGVVWSSVKSSKDILYRKHEQEWERY